MTASDFIRSGEVSVTTRKGPPLLLFATGLGELKLLGRRMKAKFRGYRYLMIIFQLSRLGCLGILKQTSVQ